MSLVSKEEFDVQTKRIKSLETALSNMSQMVKNIVKSEIIQNSDVVEQAQAQFGMYTALCIDTVDI